MSLRAQLRCAQILPTAHWLEVYRFIFTNKNNVLHSSPNKEDSLGTIFLGVVRKNGVKTRLRGPFSRGRAQKIGVRTRLELGPVWDSVRPVVRSFGACVFVFYYEKGISSGIFLQNTCCQKSKSKMSYCVECIIDCLIDCFCCLSCSKELDFIEPEYPQYESLPAFDLDYLPMIGNPLYMSSGYGSAAGHQFNYVIMAP